MRRRATALSHEALPAALATVDPYGDLRCLAGIGAAGTAATPRLGQPRPRRILLRRAREDLQGGLGLVLRGRDLRPSLGHAAGDRARIRDRIRPRPRDGALA